MTHPQFPKPLRAVTHRRSRGPLRGPQGLCRLGTFPKPEPTTSPRPATSPEPEPATAPEPNRSLRHTVLGVGILILLIFPGIPATSADPKISQPAPLDWTRDGLAWACKYLWSQQRKDGGWHSETYGLLRSGQALTPFVLDALLKVPESVHPRPPEKVERALEFLRRHLDDDGFLGKSDPEVLEYPIYSTSYALLCFLAADRPEDKILIERMVESLTDAQFREHNGFESESPAYGGWGFGGDHPPGITGHMDLAHTRRVLQALREADGLDPAVSRAATTFLRMVQKHPDDPRPQPTLPGANPPDRTQIPYDGGFYLSPVVLDANKGEVLRSAAGEPLGLGSYASATCDGILALLAAGVTRSDERIASARRWLLEHSRVEFPEGIPEHQINPWAESVLYYHLAVRAEASLALDLPGDWAPRIAAWLTSRQRTLGQWVNYESHLMKEDDPLLATTLGIVALTQVFKKLAPAREKPIKPNKK